MNVTSVIDYSQTHLEIINEGQTFYIKKAYIEFRINPDDSTVVDMFWHWYEFNDHQRLFYLDFARITNPVEANANDLLATLQGYLISQFTILREQFTTLTAAYTLASQTAAQKIFNTPTNGAVTLAAKAYFFECVFSLSGMSATSGNFGFALGGTATFTSVQWQSNATKTTNLTNGNAAVSMTSNITTANTTISGAGTQTLGAARCYGIVRVSAGGTLIPMVSFTTVVGAVTPIVGINSYFRIWEAGANNVVSEGSWS